MQITLFSEAYCPQVNGVVTTQRKLVPYLHSRGHQVLLAVPRYKGNAQSSNVSLEAMASGVPVLAMNAGGVRTIVEHDRTGLLANSREEFAAFLDRLVEDASFRSRFGPTGRRSAEDRSWTHAFESLENSYEKVLSEGRGH